MKGELVRMRKYRINLTIHILLKLFTVRPEVFKSNLTKSGPFTEEELLRMRKYRINLTIHIIVHDLGLLNCI